MGSDRPAHLCVISSSCTSTLDQVVLHIYVSPDRSAHLREIRSSGTSTCHQIVRHIYVSSDRPAHNMCHQIILRICVIRSSCISTWDQVVLHICVSSDRPAYLCGIRSFFTHLCGIRSFFTHLVGIRSFFTRLCGIRSFFHTSSWGQVVPMELARIEVILHCSSARVGLFYSLQESIFNRKWFGLAMDLYIHGHVDIGMSVWRSSLYFQPAPVGLPSEQTVLLPPLPTHTL